MNHVNANNYSMVLKIKIDTITVITCEQIIASLLQKKPGFLLCCVRITISLQVGWQIHST